MNKFKTLLFLAMFGGIGLWGCDDSSSASSNGPDENAAEESSSSVCKDCENRDGSRSSKKVESSDSQSQDSSSDTKSNSSSSKKENVKNSSSSQKAGSSSSEFVFKLCEEGDTSTTTATKVFYYTCRNEKWVCDSTKVIEQPKVYPDMDSVSVFGSEAVYGMFTDDRDKKGYRTVNLYYDYDGVATITVMAQNLNYANITIDSNTIVFDDSKVEKRCYKDDPWYCDNYFGALYTWRKGGSDGTPQGV